MGGGGGKSSLTEVGMALIVTLHGQGYIESGIGVKLLCCKTAVPSAIVKHNTDDTFHDMNIFHRPRKTILRDDRSLRQSMRAPKSTCNKIISILR